MGRLVATLLVSSEEDTIEPLLDYHFSRGVDFVVVTANRASEMIVATVQRYVDEGRAHLIIEPGDDHAQGRWVTRMARLAATDFGADWVMHLDADEFYWPEVAEDLPTVFDAVPARWSSIRVPMLHFLPGDGDGFFADRMTLRETSSLKPSGRWRMTKVAHRASPDVVISRGLHRATGVDLPVVPGWHPISGLHFPLRSFEQFERKVVMGGEAQERNADPDNHEQRNLDRLALQRAGQLRGLYDTLRETELQRATGLESGRLTEDDRLARYLAGERVSAAARSPDELRLELLQAVHAYERSDDRLEIARLHEALRRADQRNTTLRARVAELKARRRSRAPLRFIRGVRGARTAAVTDP